MAEKILDVSIKGLDKFKKSLNPRELKRTERNALNTTATATEKLGVNEAALEYNLKKTRIKKDSKGKKLVRKKRARAGEEQASVFFGINRKGDRPGLHNFGPKKVRDLVREKKGPRTKVRRSSSLSRVPHGFILKGAGPNRKATGLFTREGEKRLPIKRETGPSTKQMVEDPKVFSKLERHTGKILERELLKAIDKQLAKR